MVTKTLTTKQEAFKNRILAGDNATVAAKAANYAPNAKNRDNVCGVIGNRLLRNVKIKQAICEQRAELSAGTAWDVKESERRYKEAYDLANTCKQPSAMVSAVQAVNKMYGLDTDKGYADTAKPLTPQQQKDYDKLARDMNIRIARETA